MFHPCKGRWFSLDIPRISPQAVFKNGIGAQKIENPCLEYTYKMFETTFLLLRLEKRQLSFNRGSSPSKWRKLTNIFSLHFSMPYTHVVKYNGTCPNRTLCKAKTCIN